MRIATLTVNPSLDVSTSVERVVPDDKLRAERPDREPGGGGINVARVVRRLGEEVVAVLTRGGAAGSTLEALLAEEGLDVRCVDVADDTRENISVIDRQSERQYRFVMPGPEMSAEDWHGVTDVVGALAPRPDWLVISGSLAPGLPDDAYAQLATACRERGVRIVLDTSGPPLRAALEAGVHLVKPNLGELASLVGHPLDDDRQLADAVEALIADGAAEVVVVSRGGGGAYVAGREVEAAHVRAPTVPVRSTVGAGDSMVGGMVVALARGWEPADAARFGVAAGTAAVMTPGSELCRRDDTERLYAQMS